MMVGLGQEGDVGFKADFACRGGADDRQALQFAAFGFGGSQQLFIYAHEYSPVNRCCDKAVLSPFGIASISPRVSTGRWRSAGHSAAETALWQATSILPEHSPAAHGWLPLWPDQPLMRRRAARSRPHSTGALRQTPPPGRWPDAGSARVPPIQAIHCARMR